MVNYECVYDNYVQASGSIKRTSQGFEGYFNWQTNIQQIIALANIILCIQIFFSMTPCITIPMCIEYKTMSVQCLIIHK